MADPGKGRGRGLALLQQLKKSQTDSPPSSGASSSGSSTQTPHTSVTPTPPFTQVSGSAVPQVGRGRLLTAFQEAKSPVGPMFLPASDVNPGPPAGPSRGVGRGLKLLENLKSKPKPVTQVGAGDVSSLTTQMGGTMISDKTTTMEGTVTSKRGPFIPKNKYFREVKDTPPVVMKGETGTPCEVTANYVFLRFEENNVYEYEVKYEPEQDYKALRMKLLNVHSDLIKEKTFDGTTLYTPHRLPDEVTDLISTNPYDNNSTVHIKIIFRRTRLLSEMIHLYNVLFKHIMRDLQLVRFGRQHFNEHAAIQIPQHKLEVWPGYVTAVDEYEGGLMLTLDSTHRVLRTQSVLNLIRETVQREGANWKKAITESLVGCSVMTTYNKKLFRVDSIASDKNPMSTFEVTKGGQTEEISFMAYYKKNYGIDIVDLEQPLLISRQSKRMAGAEATTDFLICLVPELCQLTGLTDDQRNDFRLMKDVATYTRITPNQRHAAFRQYIKNVLSNETARKRLAGWGLSISDETINLTARVLPPETLYFGRNVKVPGNENAEWNNVVTRNAVMQAVDILNWVILFTKRDEKVTKNFVETIKSCSRPMGLTIAEPQMISLPSDRPDAYVNGLKKCYSKVLQLVVIICPNSRDDRYAMIKKICCVDNPVPSQVINSRTITNQQKVRAIVQKIALQINCKLGGTLWSISIPFKSAMVIGIDSYHEANRKGRSVCAFVASYNQVFTHWYARAIFQNQGQEIVDGLKSCFAEALKHFIKINGNPPDRIIVYRDGVGDGQLKLLKEYEIPQLEVSFKLLDEMYNPKLTYIVVQKRINTRIFRKLNGSQLENPSPGTIVDYNITRRDWYDFLIVSQKVNQGTVTPTHYIVLHDTSGLSPDQCQRLTYKMCHLYYNWPGTVRVPAPCQYAHKLAYLVGQSIHQSPSELLSDKLFFL